MASTVEICTDTGLAGISSGYSNSGRGSGSGIGYDCDGTTDSHFGIYGSANGSVASACIYGNNSDDGSTVAANRGGAPTGPTGVEVSRAISDILACTTTCPKRHPSTPSPIASASATSSSLKVLRRALCCLDPPPPVQEIVEAGVVTSLLFLLRQNGVCAGITNTAATPVFATGFISDNGNGNGNGNSGSDGDGDGDCSPYDVICDTIWCLTNIATGMFRLRIVFFALCRVVWGGGNRSVRTVFHPYP